MSEPYRTMDVDLAAYLTTLGYVCTGVRYNEKRKLGEFEFGFSPGLEKEVNKWNNGGAREFKKFANERSRLYQHAKWMVKQAGGR